MPDPTPPAEPTRDQVKAALKAFRKRLKLTRLDAESQLSQNPLSTGRGRRRGGSGGGRGAGLALGVLRSEKQKPLAIDCVGRDGG